MEENKYFWKIVAPLTGERPNLFDVIRIWSGEMIAKAAIAPFLSLDDTERHEALIAQRLDQIDRRMTRLERDLGILIEAQAIFV